ncbi:right-handed parallel beta-helix repeat-containing protein [Geoalkalibacter sp.]|uniref:right-handed parallel beta-helix repeat-containing protein n=1 Tax=Geoalkalibacter sp. TaxID=3041440 RepID=UPI00272E6B0E|nr:right-handed parallel beta-helix repeat-containing protein [Geoalkalibacter sp.]
MRNFALRLRLFLGVALLGFCLTGCSVAQPLTGVLEGDQHWRGRVLLRGDVVLAEGATLHIAPGTQVLFLPPVESEDLLTLHPYFPGSELIVHGRLVARGTPSNPIQFRAADPEAGPGSWGAINLRESPEALFSHCIFTQADSAIHSFGSRVRVEHSLFEHNLVALRFNTSEIVIEHNLIRENDAGIRFHLGAPLIVNNILRDNNKSFFLTSDPRDYHIRHNNILGSREYAVVLGEEVPDEVMMADNYWGTTDARSIEDGFFDGRRLNHLGQVRYQPLATQPFAEAGPAWSP